jgi:uncharacterized membrane protein
VTNFSVKKLTKAAVIAALYFGLTMLLAPISFGALQFRISEMLCILPFFFPESVPGLFIGCMLSNLLGGYGIPDIVFGSLATLAAAVLTMKIRIKWLACLPPAIFNGVIVGAVIAWSVSPDSFWGAYAVIGSQVFIGELVVMYLLGLPLMHLLPKWKFFKDLYENGEG